MSEYKDSLHIIQLSGYDKPEIVEDKKNEWVTYGADNSYYTELIDRFTNSPTNNAIINNISRLIYGRGIYALDANRKPNEFASMISIFDSQDLRNVSTELKALGQCAFQVHYTTKGKRQVKKAFHIAVNNLAPEKCNKDGEIEAYYYSDNWEDIKKFPPKRIASFGTSKDEVEILFIKPYSIGRKYFALVDYQGVLPYAKLEEEISDYLINDVQNGFSGTKVVNFNNGVPSEEQQTIVASKVKKQLTGSRGEKLIVAFNNNKESATTVDDIPLNDAPTHYEYLSDECVNKLLVGHNIVSPMLVGVVTKNQGFSSNADEIEVSSKYFYNSVIKTYQDLIIEGMEKILMVNGISLKLYFRRLNLLEDIEAKEQEKEQVQMSSQKTLDSILKEVGEEIDLEEWELVDSRKVEYEEEEYLDNQINALNEKHSNSKKQSLLSKIFQFVSTGSAFPNAKSSQDGVLFKSRYRYSTGLNENSREFCQKMVGANKLYRKEDIQRMSSAAVNAGWGPNGTDTYDIFLYKGGGDCHHYWIRETYMKKSDVNSPNAKTITPAQARKDGEILPKNDNRVYTAPKDMPNNGFLPTNKRFK